MSKVNTLFTYFKKTESAAKVADSIVEPRDNTNEAGVAVSDVRAVSRTCGRSSSSSFVDSLAELGQPTGEELKADGKENETPASPVKNIASKRSRLRGPQKPLKRRRLIIESDSECSSADGESGDEYKPDSSESSSDESEQYSEAPELSESLSEVESEVNASVKLKAARNCETRSKVKSMMSKSLTMKCVDAKSSISVKPCKVKSGQPLPAASDSSNQWNSCPVAAGTTVHAPLVSVATKLKLAAFSASEEVPHASQAEDRCFPHMRYDFLQPSKIRDSAKRSIDDPDYDPRTLYVPESFLKDQTPAMRQWWELKLAHFDTILFFKMGKFYELFHMDAVIAVTHLGLIYMKGEHAHSGFPEIAYSRYSDTLIQKGYKVARVEQTETPEMMAERIKQMPVKSVSKVDRVVRREICSIQTKGTKRFSFIDGDSCDSGSQFLLAICEKFNSVAGSSTYGVCFVDTSIGTFHIGQFEDDYHTSRLRTLIAHYPPAHVLFERGKVSDRTQSLLITNLAAAYKDSLRSGVEFWECSKTLQFLSESEYFIDESNRSVGCQWPPVLKSMLSNSDSLGLTSAKDCDLAIRSLGAIVWNLKCCLMDYELLSLRSFISYVPVDLIPTSSPAANCTEIEYFEKRCMVLDGVTLANLDILVNNSTNSSDGTLISCVDRCQTAFGKRLLKQWICSPLCNPDAINDRLDAVDDLAEVSEVVADVSELLKKMPDLERLLSKIHTLGSGVRSKAHPDCRAVLFEDVVYSKRKIEDFLLTLDGFKTSMKIIELLSSVAMKFRSKVLRQCSLFKDSSDNCGHFPHLQSLLEFFDKSFDHQKARSVGVIKPSKGVDPDYDTAVNDILSVEKELSDYLEKQKKILGCKTVVYWGTGKNRYQMELPDSVAKKVPDQYEVTSQKKGSRRYRTHEIERLLVLLTDAEDRRDAAQKDTMRRIFFQFDEQPENTLIALTSELNAYRLQLINSSNATFQSAQLTHPSLEIQHGRYPCIGAIFSGGDFIPNDTVIGVPTMEGGKNSDANIVLVTGPNMGGKSTLMRQVGTIVILAHLGCYVPAEACCLSPVDRIFTRLGATDRIMSGESTFFVELSETAVVLQHATIHSLVLLDELGRGTATHDGTAIACAVVQELCSNVKCRAMFSTHYHSLVEEFASYKDISLGHMACMVENENDDDPSQETITFLYKFIAGSCPKSYGFNAARLANIPDEVIRNAHWKAKEFEESVSVGKLFRELWAVECQDAGLLSMLSTLQYFM